MNNFLFGIAVLAIISGLIPFVFSLRFKKYVSTAYHASPIPYEPKVSLIMPCKGLDPGFEENIQALLAQDYPDYEIVFVTATKEDPAYLFLNHFIHQLNSDVAIKLISAGLSDIRGEKINNLLSAVDRSRKDTEVYVFVDSDVRPGMDFLKDLINPLQDEAVGVSTGIRWYLPEKANLGSMLRSVWAAGALPMMINHRLNFAFGGGNAVKKSVYESAKIGSLLERSISDTFAITNAVKAIGLKIQFVPQCVLVSHEDSTIPETVEWSNRQTIISRVYSPPFWWAVFLTYSLSNTMLVLGLCSVFLSFFGFSGYFLPGILMLSIIPLEILHMTFMLPTVKRMLPEHGEKLDRLKWKYFLTTPLASILIMVNSLTSIFTNQITWRGVTYRLVSPRQTEILNR